MATSTSTPDDLRRAAKIVQQVLGTLDTTKVQCDCCGLRRYQTYAEAKAYDELAGVPDKLRRWAKALEQDDSERSEGGLNGNR